MFSPENFSITKFLENPSYARKFKKYFSRNVFLDTYAFCLIVLGKFDDIYNYNSLAGEPDQFMNFDTYQKLIRILDKYQRRVIVTPAVVIEGLKHMFSAIEGKYRGDHTKLKEIENHFADFLKNEIKVFHEKHPLIHETINHAWTDMIKYHKLRDRFEMGELSIFVESDKCKYATIVTNDAFKVSKGILPYSNPKILIIKLNVVAIS